MSDTKISALPAAASAVGTDELPINKAGASQKVTFTQVKAFFASGDLGVAGALAGSTLSGTGEIVPALAGATNNWAPAGIATASTVLLGATAAATITGITGGWGGRILHLVNWSVYNVTIDGSANAASSAANRIGYTGWGSLVLAPQQGCTLIYSAAAALWLVVGKS